MQPFPYLPKVGHRLSGPFCCHPLESFRHESGKAFPARSLPPNRDEGPPDGLHDASLAVHADDAFAAADDDANP